MRRSVSCILFLKICFSVTAQDAELVLPYGHQNSISKSTISADEKLLVTASADNSISFWELQTGKEIRKLKWHTGPVLDIALSTNNRYLVSVSEDGRAIIWNALNGKVLKLVALGYEPANHVRLSPRNNFFVTTQYLSHKNETVIRFYSIPNGNLDREFSLPDEQVLDLVIHEKKASIFVLTGKGTIHQIDGNNFTSSRVETGFTGQVGCINSNADKVAIATGSSVTAFAFTNSNSSQLASVRTGKPVQGLLFTRNADSLFVSSSNSLSCYPLQNKNTVPSKQVRVSGITNISLSHSGNYLAVGSASGKSFLFNTDSLLQLQVFEGRTLPLQAIVVPAKNDKIISLYDNGTIKQWKISDRIMLDSLMNLIEPAFDLSGSEEGSPLIAVSDKSLYKADLTQKTLVKIGDGDDQIVKAIISADEKWVAVLYKNGILKTGRSPDYRLQTIVMMMGTEFSTQLQFTNENLVVFASGSFLTLANPENGASVKKYKVPSAAIMSFTILPGGNVAAVSGNKSGAWIFTSEQDSAIAYFSPNSLYMNKPKYFDQLALSNDGKLLIVSGPQQLIHLFNIPQNKEILNYYGHTGNIRSLYFTKNKQQVISAGDDRTIRIWPLQLDTAKARVIALTRDNNYNTSIILTNYNAEDMNNFITPSQPESASFVAFKDDDWIIVTPDRYYFCNKNAARYLGYNINGRFYSFEQFDLKYNRPDKILQAIGITDSTLIQAYYRAYLKRLKNAGFTEDQLLDDLNLPEIKIINKDSLPASSNQKEMSFKLELFDEKADLKKFQCWINGIPLAGKKGFEILNDKINRYQTEVEVPLMKGMNKIQFSAWNVNGVESYKATFNVQCTYDFKILPALHLIAFSVSDYLDKDKSLKYAVKDGRDIVLELSRKKGYREITVDTLFNKDATLKKMLALKNKLLKGTVNDEVILFVSGHGLIDANLDFYFAAYDIDFENPSAKGISFDQLEELLDSIPQRKKLMLMDACHSGELDKETVLPVSGKNKNDDTSSTVVTYGARGLKLGQNDSKVGLENSFELMQELFAGVNKGSGTIVISAASGKGVAFESPVWNNGAFTYSFLNGLRTRGADLNKDRFISAMEMLTYVANLVEKITQGAQKPTSRRENPDFDWNLW